MVKTVCCQAETSTSIRHAHTQSKMETKSLEVGWLKAVLNLSEVTSFFYYFWTPRSPSNPHRF